jgi:hypothetical protein
MRAMSSFVNGVQVQHRKIRRRFSFASPSLRTIVLDCPPIGYPHEKRMFFKIRLDSLPGQPEAGKLTTVPANVPRAA